MGSGGVMDEGGRFFVVAVPCCLIPRVLVDLEVVGYEKNMYTCSKTALQVTGGWLYLSVCSCSC